MLLKAAVSDLLINKCLLDDSTEAVTVNSKLGFFPDKFYSLRRQGRISEVVSTVFQQTPTGAARYMQEQHLKEKVLSEIHTGSENHPSYLITLSSICIRDVAV